MKPLNVALILGALLTIILGSVVAWSYLHNPWFGPDLDDDLFFEDEDQYQAASWTRPQNLEGPLSPADVHAVRGQVAKAADYMLSAPYTHANLTVFLIQGPETLPDRTYLSLQE